MFPPLNAPKLEKSGWLHQLKTYKFCNSFYEYLLFVLLLFSMLLDRIKFWTSMSSNSEPVCHRQCRCSRLLWWSVSIFVCACVRVCVYVHFTLLDSSVCSSHIAFLLLFFFWLLTFVCCRYVEPDVTIFIFLSPPAPNKWQENAPKNVRWYVKVLNVESCWIVFCIYCRIMITEDTVQACS